MKYKTLMAVFRVSGSAARNLFRKMDIGELSFVAGTGSNRVQCRYFVLEKLNLRVFLPELLN
jgi:hypothetical protein